MTQESRNRDDVLELYFEGPVLMEQAFQGLADPELDLSLGPGTWSIRQYVQHVVDGDDIWRTPIRAALGGIERSFSLQWYWDLPQVTWGERWAYVGRELDPSLALLHAGRRFVAGLLSGISEAWDQSLTMRWPNGQEEKITVGDIVQIQADHIIAHISDIQAIRETHGL